MVESTLALNVLDCRHFAAGTCTSCRWLTVPSADQLTRKQAHAHDLLPVPEQGWEAAAPSAVAGFRNKAKMAVGGTVEAPTLGLVALDGSATDLRDCQLHDPALTAALPVLADFIGTARLAPYRLDTRAGELKHLVVTLSPTGDLLVRFVLRSREPETRVRKHLPALLEALPNARVVSLNIQPEHKAVLEGELEIVLTQESLLAMPLELSDGRTLALGLRPQGFFQTNTAMARELYSTAARWTGDLTFTRAWDLYSGVGGFACALAAPGRSVIGVETSAEAVAAGNAMAPEGVEFVAADAGTFAREATEYPDLVVVNPPRRGIGDLAEVLEASGVPTVLYSSCNVATLAGDLARMGSYAVVRGRVLDMFAHTPHHEVMVLLARR